MDHKHFHSAKRPLSVIFNGKPTNQVIRYVHEGQASAKIMLEQKANFYNSSQTNQRTLIVEQQYKNVNEINRLNALVNWKISLSFVRKHLYSMWIFYHFHDHFNNNRNLMYFSGSEFHNKLWPWAEFLKQKNWFQNEDKHIGSNRKQTFLE